MPDICFSLNIAFSVKRKKYEQRKVGISCRQKNINFTEKVGQ